MSLFDVHEVDDCHENDMNFPRARKPRCGIHREDVDVRKMKGPRTSNQPEVGALPRKALDENFSSPGDIRKSTHSLARPAGIQQPFVETARLVLRPCTLDDAPTFARLAGKREIADTTISIPYPYSEQDARDWVRGNIEGQRKCQEVAFAVVTKADGELVGAVGLRDIDQEQSQAELGFWIGVDWWGQGFATEAAQALLVFGFDALRLNRIYARHMLRNPASGRVLKRIGMQLEGVLREGVRKWGIFEDVAILSIIRREWMERGHPS